MKFLQKMTAWAVLFFCMIPMAVGCGTLLYPERRHQALQVDPAGRQIDPAVAVMDAACLIFFIIPGLVAFAVDFATGAIYLPSGHSAMHDEPADTVIVAPVDAREIENRVMALTGVPVDMEDPRMEAFVLDRDRFL
ncbi:hypothetical protein OOT00_04285 [Desulfobotulus sp. H1]|uniref:Uncharacterized protein n=1 Tax=Desulfobotulus pelophilus TaxID=2823377 RepID=A0ABT3N6W8_9BACT|nr:hypothetical protein [Desulfobotulus pelophilus]MCW7753202.1 hypothetical protein [Desulfobotulus pelophilus]